MWLIVQTVSLWGWQKIRPALTLPLTVPSHLELCQLFQFFDFFFPPLPLSVLSLYLSFIRHSACSVLRHWNLSVFNTHKSHVIFLARILSVSDGQLKNFQGRLFATALLLSNSTCNSTHSQKLLIREVSSFFSNSFALESVVCHLLGC